VARLIFVRHGRAAAGWEELDPGLDDVGRAQAAAVADVLAPIGPLPVLSSPLRRCRETSVPLAEAWGVEPIVEPAVGELPSPDGMGFLERREWLRSVLTGRWCELDAPYHEYRRALLERVAAVDVDSVIVSHFVAINAVVGAALGDDHFVILHLDNCSRTVIDVEAGRFVLVEGGQEADTLIR
jgi:broad specificity phosphatase PhoE